MSFTVNLYNKRKRTATTNFSAEKNKNKNEIDPKSAFKKDRSLCNTI